MKKGIVCSLLLYLSCASGLWAQAFQNLDFESANVSNLPPNQFEFVSVADGLPGWSAYIGTNKLTQVGHNWFTLGAPNVAILGPHYLNFEGFPIASLEGTYSAILQDGAFGDQQGQSASIAQTGLIPLGEKSVQFESTFFLGSKPGAVLTNNLFVSVGGQNVPVVPLGNYLYGCDISAFAGLEEELSFTMGTNYGNGLILLDEISFSTESVPEPSALSLLVIGVASLIFLYRTHHKMV